MFFERTNRKGCLVILAGIVAGLCLSSCDLELDELLGFSPRSSELPTGQATEYAQPVQPDVVISNLINAVGGRNADVYQEIFSRDFVFTPDPQDVLELENYYPGVFSDWDIEAERVVARHMLDPSRTSYASLRFEDDEEIVIEDTDSTYVVQENYRLLMWMESLETYTGRAIFSMKVSDGLWYIHAWEDTRPEAATEDDGDTWGMLKGEIRGTT